MKLKHNEQLVVYFDKCRRHADNNLKDKALHDKFLRCMIAAFGEEITGLQHEQIIDFLNTLNVNNGFVKEAREWAKSE